MALYTGTLNEFIDWINNRDTLTNRQVIKDTISGGSIRELIQSHLRKPFYVHEDVENNKKLLFSSEEAKIRYYKAVEEAGGNEIAIAKKYKDLVLLEFNTPAPHSIICVGENDEALKTMNILSGSARQMIKFKVYIDSLTSGLTSSYEVRFKLVGPSGIVTYEDVRQYDATSTTDVNLFDCFDYLQVGTNTLTLTVKLTGDIVAERINPQIPINIINYTINGEYTSGKWYDPIHYGNSLPLSISVNRSISVPVSQTLSCYINDYSLPKHIVSNNIEGTYANLTLTIPSEYIRECLYPTSESDATANRKHYMLIKGNMSTTDNSVNFDSNSLLYEFITQSDDQEELNNHMIIIRTSIPAGTLQTSNGLEGIYLTGVQYEEFSLEWAYFTLSSIDASISIEWELCKYDKVTGQPIEDSKVYLATLSGIRGQAGETLKFVPDKAYPESANWHLIGTVISNIIDTQTNTFKTFKAFDRQIVIEKSSFEIAFDEYPGYYFKLNAYGRSNSEAESSRQSWIPTGAITVLPEESRPKMEFSPSVPWDSANGWSSNGLTFNTDINYGTINFNAFPTDNVYSMSENGRTIEIDFMTGVTNDDNDPLVIFGAQGEDNRYDPENNNSPRTGPAIYIYPTKAILYIGSTEVIKTNFKTNERIQLSFIFMPENNSKRSIIDPRNVYIVNNGVLERGANLSTQAIGFKDGWIKIGGTNSQITVYNIRVWWKNLPIYNAFTNFLFDTPNKSQVIIRNSITKGSGSTEIDYDKCVSKVDTFLITGDLRNVLTAGVNKDDSESPVDIVYTTPTDTQYLGFTANSIKIRKHGQSTLNYPIASFKIWLNKTKGERQAQVEFKDAVKNLKLVKNRYPINVGSIPANKFVLQANYADSSGVHNGGLLKLINDTWYNAPFKNSTTGKTEYKLRTAPQLFASNQTINHNNVRLGEFGDKAWIEGYGNTDVVINGLNANEHTWGDLRMAETGSTDLTSFPYQIRNAPDSRPAVVFYKDTTQDNPLPKFLGQFVLMDDKKSDHIFGERSIYLWGDGSDPFCMTIEGANTMVNVNGKQKNGYDQDEYCVWDNKDVLRIECVLINTPLTSFMNFNVPSEVELDDDGNTISDQNFSGEYAASAIKYETDSKTHEFILDEYGNKKPVKYFWEDYFELIFPDDEDIAGDDIEENNLNKFSGRYLTPEEVADPNFKWPKVDVNGKNKHTTSKFIRRTQPWINFLRWICAIGQLNKKANGDPNIDGTVSEAAMTKFVAEAAEHLDLYKLAAYYIFYIRFGLVDSVERNAQYKTYDGQHWFLEAWDMDIALGNKNTGGLAFDPPMDRSSWLDETSQTYAYSGRSKTTSNVLWDCLEAWDYWANTIVPEVAQALYTGGLTYENITKVFDNTFANKWAELMYNESGMYKYVEKAQDKQWLNWLQGSRLSHRHWWVSTSMNYYDSKWTCGQFNSSRIYMAVDKPQNTEASITIVPTTESYFKLTQTDTTTNRGLIRATKENPAVWDCKSYSFSTKDPTHIFGALFIESLRIGIFGQGLQVMSFQNAVDPVLGPTLKELSIGNDIPDMLEEFADGFVFEGWVHKVAPSITNSSSTTSYDNTEGSLDALSNLVTYNIVGQLGMTEGDVIQPNRSKLKNIYAIGSGLTVLTSSLLGNTYDKIHVPSSTKEIDNYGNVTDEKIGITAIDVTNTSWKHITFWETSYNPNGIEKVPFIDDDGNVQLDPETGEYIMIEKPIPASFKKSSTVPLSFRSVAFRGSTANNVCTIDFILAWFQSIEDYIRSLNPQKPQSEIDADVLNYIGRNCTGILDNIRWNYNKKKGVHSDYRTIRYKDVIRLGYLNGLPDEDTGIGVNYGTNSSIKGYIKIEDEPMSATQLTQLTNLFGENVFSLSNINSNLVIDQENQYAQISVSGNIHLETDPNTGDSIIVCNEGALVKFKCTSFLLSSETVENYRWVVEGALGNSFAAAADGFTQNLIIEQSTRTERYPVTVTATKKNASNINSSIVIWVNPTKTALDFKFSTTNNEIRKFVCNETTAKNMFGTSNMKSGTELRDVFIIPKGDMDVEFKIDTDTPFDATIKSLSFKIGSINGSIPIRESAASGYDSNLLATQNGNEYFVTTNDFADGELIKILTDADSFITQTEKTVNGELTGIRNSIRFRIGDALTFREYFNDMKYFALYASITYNSQTIGTKTYICNIILYDDNDFIVTQHSRAFAPILNKLKEFDFEYYKSVISLYKSDLSVLGGKLEFKNDNGILINFDGDSQSFIATGKNESIFNYMPNIEEIDCANITYNFDEFTVQDATNTYFDSNKLKALKKISLKNCRNATFTLDIENSNTIEEIDISGDCTISLTVNNNRLLKTVKLGKPSSIYIKDCNILTNNGVTIDDNSRLDSIDLESNTADNLNMFKLLNKFLPD